ncbi:MAG: arsenate reductase ArsC [Bacteroidetes bacterium]|nr:arsenate reductase ArsC [Bacteroidota bacterium]
MIRKRILFVCIHNSARSQMAEALVNHLAGDRFVAESAGLEPGTLNPLAVEALKQIGIDISGKETRDVFALHAQGQTYDYVVTVCDGANGERCPVFPGSGKRLHWGFPDPSALKGSYEERLQGTIAIRNEIQARVETWLKEVQ